MWEGLRGICLHLCFRLAKSVFKPYFLRGWQGQKKNRASRTRDKFNAPTVFDNYVVGNHQTQSASVLFGRKHGFEEMVDNIRSDPHTRVSEHNFYLSIVTARARSDFQPPAIRHC